ncbi:MAG: hypothetical protein MPJ22_00350 [Pirellulales bacterium]|nr:hypothetical protein [Pirellulales bacterium]
MANDLTDIINGVLDNANLPDAQKQIIKGLAESVIGGMTDKDKDDLTKQVEEYIEKSRVDGPTVEDLGTSIVATAKSVKTGKPIEEANLFD